MTPVDLDATQAILTKACWWSPKLGRCVAETMASVLGGLAQAP